MVLTGISLHVRRISTRQGNIDMPVVAETCLTQVYSVTYYFVIIAMIVRMRISGL